MMRARVPSASSPEQTPYAAAEAAFAEATAYLASREAQQMSESALERELHRLGQELMDKLLQGHREQRNSPAEAAGPVEGTDEGDVMERSQRRVPEGDPETTTCGVNGHSKFPHLRSSKIPPPRFENDDDRSACGGCGQAVCGLSKAVWARLRVHIAGSVHRPPSLTLPLWSA